MARTVIRKIDFARDAELVLELMGGLVVVGLGVFVVVVVADDDDALGEGLEEEVCCWRR